MRKRLSKHCSHMSIIVMYYNTLQSLHKNSPESGWINCPESVAHTTPQKFWRDHRLSALIWAGLCINTQDPDPRWSKMIQEIQDDPRGANVLWALENPLKAKCTEMSWDVCESILIHKKWNIKEFIQSQKARLLPEKYGKIPGLSGAVLMHSRKSSRLWVDSSTRQNLLAHWRYLMHQVTQLT